MREQLATQLLGTLLDWNDDDVSRYVPKLVALAGWKWDEYQGYRAGQRFLENLARWLTCFDSVETRRRWLDFVLERMIFISGGEMDHAIELAYPNFIRRDLINRVAAEEGLDSFRTARITASDAFRIEKRRVLIAAISDGARIDQLRRASSELSHEQFSTTYEIEANRRAAMITKLTNATSTATGRFSQVVLVDDFYGSGTSFVDLDDEGALKMSTKLGRFLTYHHYLDSRWNNLSGIASPEASAYIPVLTDDAALTVLLYVASERAQQHIQKCLSIVHPEWKVHVVQMLPQHFCVDDPTLVEDCQQFWDPILNDDIKGSDRHLGYRDCALPVVLHHNSPNNSVCPLWAHSAGIAGGLNRHALFPRYERHHKDRL